MSCPNVLSSCSASLCGFQQVLQWEMNLSPPPELIKNTLCPQLNKTNTSARNERNAGAKQNVEELD